jgi:hypothetical protein
MQMNCVQDIDSLRSFDNTHAELWVSIAQRRLGRLKQNPYRIRLLEAAYKVRNRHTRAAGVEAVTGLICNLTSGLRPTSWLHSLQFCVVSSNS